MSVVDLCIAQLVGCGVHPWAPVAGVGILSCPEILLVLFVSSVFGLYTFFGHVRSGSRLASVTTPSLPSTYLASLDGIGNVFDL